MRKALNDNPVVQIAMVGVLIAVAGLLLFGGVLKKKDSSETTTLPTTGAAAAPGVAGAPPATDPAAAPAATDPAAAAATAGATATTASAPAGVLPTVPGPELPGDVQSAFDAGKVLVLLVVRGGGYDDRHVAKAVRQLHGLPGIAVFTTKARGIARYTRITQGVNVSRVPALVVVNPTGGGTAEASVEYGFRNLPSVVQAVRDAIYRGPTVGYSPD